MILDKSQSFYSVTHKLTSAFDSTIQPMVRLTGKVKYGIIQTNSNKGGIFIKRDKKTKVEVSKYNPVPLYRSYGVTRKEYAWAERLKKLFIDLAAVLALAGPTIYIVAAVIAIFLFSSILAKVLLWTSVVIVSAVFFTGKWRKRLSFNTKLKRLCKKENFKLCFKRNLRESLAWSPDKYDLTVETPSRLYYVHVLPIEKRRQKILFESEKEIFITTPPLKNRYTAVFDIKPKVKSLALDLHKIESSSSKEVVTIMLVLPSCEDMSYKRSNVTIIPTGNGAEHFGFTVFTAKAFLKLLTRFELNTLGK